MLFENFNKLITLTKETNATTEFSFLLFLVWTSEWINSSVRLFAAIEAYTTLVSALRNPFVWIVVLNSLSLPNINHETLINKLNIRTLERKFVYFPIRKNNTYQVVFIRAQRYFHSLSLNVLADKHVGFKRGKTPLSFKQFYYRFFIWFKKHVFLTLPFKGWRSEIHLFFEETFTFRKHPSVNFSILIRPRPRCTY